MKCQVLMRVSLSEEDEMRIASEYFQVITSRQYVRPDCLIIPRYSSLPYHDELEFDVQHAGARLINSYRQHLNIADMRNWYPVFKNQTPKTWNSVADALADNYNGPFVLKGVTNSRKHLWNTHMFAKDKEAMRVVFGRLLDDSLIGAQDIIVRQFEQFRTFDIEHIGPPVTNEWRCFFYRGFLLAAGFYWSEHIDFIKEKTGHAPAMSMSGVSFIDQIAGRLSEIDCPFVVADIAERADGSWRLVELNDGTMSGLSAVPPAALYKNLRSALDREAKPG